jgi:hypothetical protein
MEEMGTEVLMRVVLTRQGSDHGGAAERADGQMSDRDDWRRRNDAPTGSNTETRAAWSGCLHIRGDFRTHSPM